jgi:hypothetical protein
LCTSHWKLYFFLPELPPHSPQCLLRLPEVEYLSRTDVTAGFNPKFSVHLTGDSDIGSQAQRLLFVANTA